MFASTLLALALSLGQDGPFSNVPPGWTYSSRKSVDSWVGAYVDSQSAAVLLFDIGHAHIMEPVSACTMRPGSVLGTFGSQPYCAVEATDARAYEITQAELLLNEGHPFTHRDFEEFIAPYMPETGTSLLAVWMELPDQSVCVVSMVYCSLEQRARAIQFLQSIRVGP